MIATKRTRSPAQVAARLAELALEQGLCVVDGVGFDLVNEGLDLQCTIRRGSTTVDDRRPMATVTFDLTRERSEAEFCIATEALITTACSGLATAAGIDTRH